MLDQISRREIVRLIGSGAMLGLISPYASAAESDKPVTIQGRRLYDDVLEYFRLGPHRTGSEGNIAAAVWLKKEIERAGAHAMLQPWELTQFELQTRRLTVSNKAVEVFPLWLPRPTGPDGVKGSLVDMDAHPGDLRGRIALFEANGSSVTRKGNHPKMIATAADAGALAVICANDDEISDEGGTTLQRAHRLTQNSFPPYNQQQWPIPAATVAFNDFARLRSAAAAGEQAHLIIDGRLEPGTEAYNVIGRIDRNTLPIVVGTPFSGWLYNTGERGGGVALWLDLIRWAVEPDRKGTYLFVATSGHEIGHIGQDRFIEHSAPTPDETHVWVHLGSGLGSYDWAAESDGYLRRHDSGGVLVAGASPSLEPLVQKYFGDLAPYYVPAEQAQGELRGSHEAGYTTFGLFGGNMFSHSAFDGPEQVSPWLLDRLAQRLKACLVEVEKSVRSIS